jgi:hypothetical protein
MPKSVRIGKLRAVGGAKKPGHAGGNGGAIRPVAVDMRALDVIWPRHKQPVNLRIDSDIIDWFRRGGAGYQTRMNAVLRAFVDAQTRRR